MRCLFSVIGDSPWIQLGDFNVALRSSERMGDFDSSAAGEFNQCLLDINMEELATRGSWFTWSNKRGGGGANMSRIDRVLVNGDWLDMFPESEALAYVPGISDHCSLLVTVFKEVACKKPFRFFNFWMKHHQFKELVQNSWLLPVTGSPMVRLSLKLRRLKPVLRDLNANCFSNISGRVMEARTQMENLQNLCSQNPGNESLREMEKKAIRVFMELSAAEESFKKQKSRVNWLALGDQNTKFFHHKVRSNRARNKILSLVTAEGLWLDKPEEVQHEIIQFYKGLLGTKFLQSQDARASLQQIIQRKVLVQMCGELVKPVLVEEITAALKAIKGDKAPGPDGFSSSFFQQIGRLLARICL